MNQVVALVLRRMRAPFLVLIAAYTVSIVGLTLIPGTDPQGNPWRMDLFHAFYFVSYMASTIGFGEIPHPFSVAQRMWVTACIYLTVVAWLYAIGNMLALIQDPAFRHALTESAFTRGVRRIRDPFYLVCGYGGTGSLLVRSLTERGLNAVVIDISQDRVNALHMAEHPIYIPGLCADAGTPRHLEEAGLNNPECKGVVALTDNDHTNLQIAITSKLLNPRLTVICRAETLDVAANMHSFGTEHTVNPFEAFAERLAMALYSPDLHVLHEWLTGVPHTPLAPMLYPPRGRWVLCGYGRFGKALKRHLEQEGIESTVIEADPGRTECSDCVVGRGTEAPTLRQGGIEEAVGIVAGTDDDANNLSILMTARDLNPNLFFVGRQNKRYNDPIFAAAHADLVMQRSHIIAREILALITAPKLSRFLDLARTQPSAWVGGLVQRLGDHIGSEVPDIWTVCARPESAPGLFAALQEGMDLTLDSLTRDPGDRDERLRCLPLMLVRKGKERLLPSATVHVERGDEILFAGSWRVQERQQWILNNLNALTYIATGRDRPAGLVWRYLSRDGGA